MPLTRRDFLQMAGSMVIGMSLRSDAASSRPERKKLPCVSTVLGPVAATALGVTLVHEHIMVDFIGAEKAGPHRYQSDEVVTTMLPYLQRLRTAGCRTLIDCTPKYLGRDIGILRTLSEMSKVQIMTCTGLYKDPYLPAWAQSASAQHIADDWCREATEGIDDSSVRAGFIKIAANEGDLNEVQAKITRAAALTHLRTGLTIASHTTQGKTALQQLDLLIQEGVGAQAFIWVHADAEADGGLRREAAARRAWIELDGVNEAAPERHITLIKEMLAAKQGGQVLLSRDAGWYTVGEVGGGKPRSYEPLLTQFLPALKAAGISQAAIRRILTENVQRALAPVIRRA